MSVSLTRHAAVRSRQRGIPKDCVDLILRYGKPKIRPGNTVEYRIRKRDKNRIIRDLKILINKVEKSSQKAVLLDRAQEEVVTVYHRE